MRIVRSPTRVTVRSDLLLEVRYSLTFHFPRGTGREKARLDKRMLVIIANQVPRKGFYFAASQLEEPEMYSDRPRFIYRITEQEYPS